jgi:hypothetical protein
MFDVAAHEPGLVLAGELEGIIDGESEICIALVLLRRAAYMDLPPVRKREPDTDLILTASRMPIAGTFEDNAGSRHRAKAALQFPNMLINPGPQLSRYLDIFK